MIILNNYYFNQNFFYAKFDKVNHTAKGKDASKTIPDNSQGADANSKGDASALSENKNQQSQKNKEKGKVYKIGRLIQLR